MSRPAFNQKRILAMLAVLLALASLLPQRWAGALSATPSHALTAVLCPFTDRLNRFSTFLRAPADLTLELGDRAQMEARLLQTDGLILKLQHDLDEAHKTIARMSELRQVMQPSVGTPRPADVVASLGGGFNSGLTINVGGRDGVQTGMVVTSGYCLVGRIADAGPASAVVRLITAPTRTPLGVRIAPPAPSGGPSRELVTWAKVAPGASELWADTDINAPVQIGDLARLFDDGWPAEARGFVVGKVVRIEKLPENPLLQHRVVIVPVRPLAYLSRVEVIIPGRSTSR